MVAYATREDFYALTALAGMVVQRRRQITSADATNDWLTVANHGLTADQPVTLVIDPSSTLPDPLAVSTTYYAIVTDGDRFQLAATAGGAAIDLTDTGTGVFGLNVSADELVDAALDFQSRTVDDHLPAHQVPLTSPYPEWVIGAVAKLAAREVMQSLNRRHRGVELDAERIDAQLAERKRGLPLRDENATARANLAVSWGAEARGWDLESGRVL